MEDVYTHIDDPVFWIVSVGAADVEPGSIAHGLDDADVIATIVKLQRKEEKHIRKRRSMKRRRKVREHNTKEKTRRVRRNDKRWQECLRRILLFCPDHAAIRKQRKDSKSQRELNREKRPRGFSFFPFYPVALETRSRAIVRRQRVSSSSSARSGKPTHTKKEQIGMKRAAIFWSRCAICLLTPLATHR